MGILEGILQRQQYESGKIQQQQMQQNMQMKAMQMKAFQQEQQYQMGARQAFSQGGVTGMMDFMKQQGRADDYMKMQQQVNQVQKSFYDSQLALGKSTNEATKFAREQQMQAGKMYASLMQMQQNNPQQFQQFVTSPKGQSMIKHIDPGSDGQFQPGRAQLLMGMSSPQEKLYNLGKQENKYKQDMDQLEAEKTALLQQGVPKDAPVYKSIERAQQEADDNKRSIWLQKIKETIKRSPNVEKDLRSTWEGAQSREKWSESISASSKVATLADSAREGNVGSQIAMINAYARALSPGVVAEPDYQRISALSGVAAELLKKVRNGVGGQALSASDVEQLRAAALELREERYDHRDRYIKDMDKLATKKNINPELVVFNRLSKKERTERTAEAHLAREKVRIFKKYRLNPVKVEQVFKQLRDDPKFKNKSDLELMKLVGQMAESQLQSGK